MTLPPRIWQKVTVSPSGCWEWTASCDTGGYGHVRWEGQVRPCHRLFYEALVGQIPDGLTLDHLCRNRRCVHPLHLEPVTLAENIARRKLSICPNGHEYTPENTSYRESRPGQISRSCVSCQRESSRRFRREHVPVEGLRSGDRHGEARHWRSGRCKCDLCYQAHIARHRLVVNKSAARRRAAAL